MCQKDLWQSRFESQPQSTLAPSGEKSHSERADGTMMRAEIRPVNQGLGMLIPVRSCQWLQDKISSFFVIYGSVERLTAMAKSLCV